MEVVVVLVVLFAVGLLAARWGAAVRLAEDQRSAEMARLVHTAAGRGRWVRGHLAAVLTPPANWLDPRTAHTAGARRALGMLGGSPVGRPPTRAGSGPA